MSHVAHPEPPLNPHENHLNMTSMKNQSAPDPTRRTFLISATAAATLAAASRTLFAQNSQESRTALEATLARDPLRPQFHLLPARNWMNDPNGPIYYRDNYHMFFQYNPLAAVWGDMSWNHAISKDMLHWTHLPLALTPTPGSPDAYGCFSGSALAVGNRVYVVYTGTVKSTPALATIHADLVQESQCLAWSDDPKLIDWHKDPLPIIPLPPKNLSVTGFRDPSVWRSGDLYSMTVGSGITDVGGCVLLYQSKDLKHWTYLHPLTSGQWNGRKTPNPCDDGEMWECPDFFPLDGLHLLIYSTLGKVIWQSGKLDEATLTFHPLHSGELDLGSFYAPKTQLDAHGRRILWGWIREQRSEDAMRAAGWSGMMSLPRVLSLDPNGILHIQTLPSTETLRSTPLPTHQTPTGTRTILPKANGELLLSSPSGQDFSLSIHAAETEVLHLTYTAKTHTFLIDGKEFTLQPHDTPNLHAFVDGSVIELLVGSRVGYTKRFYYTESVAPDMVVVADGTDPVSLAAWSIAPISENRLTTPTRSIES